MTLQEAIIHFEQLIEGHGKLKSVKAVTLEECNRVEEYKQLVKWLTILSDVYSVIDEYDIAFHRDREDLTSMEVDILRALEI